jgi:hypothetical protein
MNVGTGKSAGCGGCRGISVGILSKLTRPYPRPVYIEWCDEKDDWHWYDWLGTEGCLVRLQGRADPDGNAYSGGPMWVPVGSFVCMVEE